MSSNPQAESVIKNIIREICFDCSAQGQSVSETLAAFMVNEIAVCVCVCMYVCMLLLVITVVF